MLPNFLIIGAMKAGTDSLWQYLRHHPQVFMSELKEPDFFVAELNWKHGLSWYEEHFQDANGAVATGEASTNYAKYPTYDGVPERIAKTLPDVRLIYLVRHPLQRIHSQYLHQVLTGNERRPPERAFVEDPSYVNFSSYALQIDRYLDHFDRGQLLVVQSEALRSDREHTMWRICSFLGLRGVPPVHVLAEEFHQTSQKRVLRRSFEWAHRLPAYSRAVRLVPTFVKEATYRLRTRGIDPSHATIGPALERRLEDLLRNDVRRLRSHLGEGFDGWGIA